MWSEFWKWLKTSRVRLRRTTPKQNSYICKISSLYDTKLMNIFFLWIWEELSNKTPLWVHMSLWGILLEINMCQKPYGQRNTLLIDEGPILGHLMLTIEAFPMVREPWSITFLDRTPILSCGWIVVDLITIHIKRTHSQNLSTIVVM